MERSPNLVASALDAECRPPGMNSSELAPYQRLLRLWNRRVRSRLAATRRGFVYWHSVPAKGQRVGSLLSVNAAGSFEEKSAIEFAAGCASRRAKRAALQKILSSSRRVQNVASDDRTRRDECIPERGSAF